MKNFLILLGIFLLFDCSQKKENKEQDKAILSALNSRTVIETKESSIPIAPSNFNFSSVNKSQIEIQNIPTISNGISKPFITIALNADFSEKVYSGFITSGQTFTLPLVLPNSIDKLYYRIYTSMNTAITGSLTRSNDNFTVTQ